MVFHGLLGVGFVWHIDLMQPISNESLPKWAEAYSSCNCIPFFPSSTSTYNGGAVYALLSMLVLEIRYQEMEKRVAELLESDTEYDRMVVLGTEIQQIKMPLEKPHLRH